MLIKYVIFTEKIYFFKIYYFLVGYKLKKTHLTPLQTAAIYKFVVWRQSATDDLEGALRPFPGHGFTWDALKPCVKKNYKNNNFKLPAKSK